MFFYHDLVRFDLEAAAAVIIDGGGGGGYNWRGRRGL